MVNAGRHMVRMGDDGWAVYSQDGSLAAHFEFTVAITADGPRILTPWHEEEARSEEHTSELQSRQYLVCRLLLEKKNQPPTSSSHPSTLRSLHYTFSLHPC